MSGVTNGTREYWVGFFRRKVEYQISLIKQQHREEMEAFKEKAVKSAVERLGISQEYDEYLELVERKEQLEKERSRLETEIREMDERIFKMMYGRKPEWNERDQLLSRVKKAAEYDLKKFLKDTPWGQKITDFLDLQENIEAQIMLATTEKSLADFVKGKLTELGVEI